MTTKKREFKVVLTPVKGTMKRLSILLMIMIMFMFLTSAMTVAQDTGSGEEASIFNWLTGDSPDWSTGILYGIMGFVGALVTVFGLIGGAVPGTAGFVRIEANLKRLEEREKILDELIKNPPENPEVLKAVESATNNLRDDLRVDRWRQFMLATVLYAFLGAFFASLLAKGFIQAMVVGAGWTGFIGALGLKRDYAERKLLKDETTKKLETALSQATKQVLKEKDLSDLKLEASVSRAL